MQLPIDIKALLDETTNIQAARETPIAVSVYLDEEAPNDLIAHVRNQFASSLPTVRMTIMYVGPNFAPQQNDDIAILVAGASPDIGKYAADLRAAEVPVMVVTTQPVMVAAMAEQAGYPIPKGDLIFPLPRKDARDDKTEDEEVYTTIELQSTALAIPGENEDEKPIVLDDVTSLNLDDRMGRWIVSVCREKRLAYAIAFPFVRKPLAHDAIQATAMQNAAVGLLPFIPGADLPIMTLNQAKMVLQIAAAYGQDMTKERLKELAAVLGTAYFSRTFARELTEFIPVLGFAFRTGIAYGATAALGYGIIEYFEGGQNVTGVANVIEKAVGTGTKIASFASQKAAKLSGLINR